MNRVSKGDDLCESSGVSSVAQENSINNSNVDNIAIVNECLDDSDFVLSEAEDLTKFCHFTTDETEQQNSYHDEWERLFGGIEYIDKIRSTGIKGHLRNCRFRSLCWRVYLECLPEDKALWVDQTKLLRNQYEEILLELQTNPRCDSEDMDLCLNNPLSQSEASPWNQYFQDSELKLTIQQDVSRTFPEIEFFHTEEVQSMMVNVLFCYARKFPHISYRQGMHELLAPIIFVLHSDQQAYLHATEIELLDMFKPNTRFDISIILNPNYTEHDAFFLMCQLMEAVEGWYVLNETIITKGLINFNLEPFVRDPEFCPGNALGVKLTKIYEQLLRRHDPELFSHLEQLEIAPQIYGISTSTEELGEGIMQLALMHLLPQFTGGIGSEMCRWLRLLFGREFAMQDLLVIWDAIFANSLSFDLVDYIFTAMLVFIRDLLLSSDYSSCISHLMRYPAVADVHYLIDLALHLKNPMQHSRPIGYSGKMLHHVPLVGGRKEIHRAPLRVGNSSSAPSQSQPEKTESTRPTSLALPGGISSDTNVRSQHFRAAVNSGAEQSSFAECNVQGDGRESPLSHGLAKVLIGNGSYNITNSNVPHSMNYLETDKTKIARPAAVKEMVPLVPQNVPSGSQVHSEHTLKRKGKLPVRHKDEHLKQLTLQIAEMQAMSEYCGRWMTVHLDKLQACMERQKLQDEDNMLIALAGLKRLRDILNGTVSFSQEVTDDEDMISASKAPESVDDPSQKLCDNQEDNPVEDFVLVQEDMCDGKNSRSPSKSISSQTESSAKSNVSEPPCEADSRSLGKSLATVARRELCKLFLVSSPVTEKQNGKHSNS